MTGCMWTNVSQGFPWLLLSSIFAEVFLINHSLWDALKEHITQDLVDEPLFLVNRVRQSL